MLSVLLCVGLFVGCFAQPSGVGERGHPKWTQQGVVQTVLDILEGDVLQFEKSLLSEEDMKFLEDEVDIYQRALRMDMQTRLFSHRISSTEKEWLKLQPEEMMRVDVGAVVRYVHQLWREKVVSRLLEECEAALRRQYVEFPNNPVRLRALVDVTVQAYRGHLRRGFNELKNGGLELKSVLFELVDKERRRREDHAPLPKKGGSVGDGWVETGALVEQMRRSGGGGGVEEKWMQLLQSNVGLAILATALLSSLLVFVFLYLACPRPNRSPPKSGEKKRKKQE